MNRTWTELSPSYDPWDPIRSLRQYGRHTLTSVEFTVSNLCNMRCEHCAVGDTLVMQEGPKLPLADALRKLDEVEHLETISITGGEPTFSVKTVKDYMVPLLRYAHERGVRTQINSNLTLDLERYEWIAPYLDVMHISFNYTNAEDFHEVGFVRSGRPVGIKAASRLYERMLENAAALSKGGMFISAESMLNTRTHDNISEIHRLIVEMGCRRHEVHPMYPSSFASNLPILSLDQMRETIHRLLDSRDPDMWILLGTLPFFACSSSEEDQMLLRRLRNEPNVTVRNDPDGRNRLNVNMFTGDIYVTDFADVPALGNLSNDRLEEVFDRWIQHPLSRTVDCHCPAAACCGPNLLVANSYYPGEDFTRRIAII
ncbi:radical SAM/CxCxxxxC motif protein YfkAB [Paenibacillus sp. FJAT-26967]|uniref:radical SAM/CxCxxxxC motif protein YfkAB n=1 Tax=Paenibacillus sp. FJAT-26967 TaxID=1729690 RepID=UPI0008399BA0|nr:radical SAM/CxCxxxxC motif protein YfkAB [Paenibacillus sp. FJAT-26967]